MGLVALDRERAAVSAWRRLLLLVPAVVIAAAVALPVNWSAPLPLCLVKGITGLDCPGCGMTRAFLLIGHGRIGDAFAMHPAGVAAFAIVAGMAVVGIVRAVRGRRTGPQAPPIPL